MLLSHHTPFKKQVYRFDKITVAGVTNWSTKAYIYDNLDYYTFETSQLIIQIYVLYNKLNVSPDWQVVDDFYSTLIKNSLSNSPIGYSNIHSWTAIKELYSYNYEIIITITSWVDKA